MKFLLPAKPPNTGRFLPPKNPAVHFTILAIKHELFFLLLFAVCVRALQDLSREHADVSVKGILGDGFVLLSICQPFPTAF